MSDNPLASDQTPTRRVLVVDDEQGLADLYAIWLEDHYTVRTAYNGSEALEIINQNIDVVLLDRRMPDMSGDEVLTEIRRRDLPCRVAMVTAVEPDVEVIEMGFDDYIPKPVSEDQLRDVVDSLFTRRQYDTRIQRLFSLMSKKQVLEAENPGTDLATHDEYTALVDRIADLQSVLDEHVQSFDSEDVRASLLTLESTQIDRGSQEHDQQNETDRDGSFDNVE